MRHCIYFISYAHYIVNSNKFCIYGFNPLQKNKLER